MAGPVDSRRLYSLEDPSGFIALPTVRCGKDTVASDKLHEWPFENRCPLRQKYLVHIFAGYGQ